MEEMHTCFPPRNLGLGDINNLVAFAICRAYKTLPPCTFSFSFVSTLIGPILKGDFTYTLQPVDLYTILVREHTRSQTLKS